MPEQTLQEVLKEMSFADLKAWEIEIRERNKTHTSGLFSAAEDKEHPIYKSLSRNVRSYASLEIAINEEIDRRFAELMNLADEHSKEDK